MRELQPEKQKPFRTHDCTKPRLMRELQPNFRHTEHVHDCTKPRLMRELQPDYSKQVQALHCTKPRLMRELQLRKPWGVKNTRLYQTKTHEGTTTQEACSRIKRLLYQTKTHEGTTTSFLSVFFTNNCTKPRLMRELQPQSAT